MLNLAFIQPTLGATAIKNKIELPQELICIIKMVGLLIFLNLLRPQ